MKTTAVCTALVLLASCGPSGSPVGDLVDASQGSDAAGVDASALVDAAQGDASSSDAESSDASSIAGADCSSAIPLALESVDGSTVGALDNLSQPSGGAGCTSGGAASGPERVYRLELPPGTNVRARVMTEDQSFDPMLYAIVDCEFTQGCLDASILNGAGEQESIVFTMPASGEAFVVVDGELVSSGSYSLEISEEK